VLERVDAAQRGNATVKPIEQQRSRLTLCGFPARKDKSHEGTFYLHCAGWHHVVRFLSVSFGAK
jgi:hypothetical protein